MSDDLWPEITPITFRAPVAVIKEQASRLGSKTQNVVIAQVVAKSSNSQDLVFHFNLVAPALGNYTLLLFAFGYNLTKLYPVTMQSPFLASNPNDFTIARPGNEEELLLALKALFSNPKTVSAI